MTNLETALLLALVLVIAIPMHEAAHGFAANRLGDDTAKRAGRVTLNPLKHIDLYGTILVPVLLRLAGGPSIGYAKPVPVDFGRLRAPRFGGMLVALAGPAVNVVLAYLSALALHIEAWGVTPERIPLLFMALYTSVTLNSLLATFNMIPLLPLDGGRVFNALLPRSLATLHAKTERYGMLILLLLFVLPSFLDSHSILATGVADIITVPADGLRSVILHAAGVGNDS